METARSIKDLEPLKVLVVPAEVGEVKRVRITVQEIRVIGAAAAVAADRFPGQAVQVDSAAAVAAAERVLGEVMQAPEELPAYMEEMVDRDAAALALAAVEVRVSEELYLIAQMTFRLQIAPLRSMKQSVVKEVADGSVGMEVQVKVRAVEFLITMGMP